MTATGTPEPRLALRRAMHTLGYEVLPLARTRESVLEHVPRDIGLSVTASPQKGVDATTTLACGLTADGYTVTPHLSARLLTDRAQVDDVLARLGEAGITRLFVVGGDGPPLGAFPEALSLLRAVRENGHPFHDVGIGGYPEGHPAISEAALVGALREKAALADHVVSQMCFAPATIARWARSLAAQGVSLPVKVGIPGPISRQKLVRISATIGVGDSARFLRKQSGLVWRFLRPGGFDPRPLVRGLRSSLADDSPVAGFHVYTFNDLEGTERWRRETLARLDGQRP